jgi:SAM-dependent methyltransferase
MADNTKAFRDFEQAGWEEESVCARYDDLFSIITVQSIEPLLNHAKVGPGTHVLDVATGAGYVAGAAAERGAEAVGVDLSSAQIEMARQRFPAATFELCDGDALPFPDGSFDAVVNNYGMPHFAEPEAAIAEGFRVLKRGGRFAFAVLDRPERAVGVGAVYAAIQAHGSLDVGLPPGPSYFLFSDPEECQRCLSAAGFESVSVTHVLQTWRVPSPDTVIETISQGTVRAAATLNAQPPEAKEAIFAAIRETVRRYEVGGSIELPMPAVIAGGTRP